jgi:carbon-monoxide dehydrogenase medium subunit
MKTLLNTFDYVAAKTIGEVTSLLDQYGDRAKIIAGGTDLIGQMAKQKSCPEWLIDIGRIAELDFISESNGTLRIGALATFHDIEISPVMRANAPILASAAARMGKPQIRNRGTIGGNLANGSPAADSASPLLALDAEVVLVSKTGERSLPLTDFFLDHEKTALRSDEMLTEIRVPRNKLGGAKGEFIKLGLRMAACLSIACVSVLIGRDNRDCTLARIALGAVAPTPIRAFRAEEFLTGKELTDQVLDEVSEIVAGETRPISDVRATKEYRREASRVLVRRAIERVL